MIGAALLAGGLSLFVTPRVAFAPADVVARARLEGLPTARQLQVAFGAADGHEQYSEIPIFPCASSCRPQRTVLIPAWRALPPGEYVVLVVVVDAGGAALARASASAVHVVAPGGQP